MLRSIGLATPPVGRRLFLASGCVIAAASIASRASPAPEPADAFVASLQALCGQAFEGRIVENVPADPADPFAGQRLVMHVRECSAKVLRIPFHVGDDRSRTWVITRTATGLKLEHDHRHADGSADAMTNYGGTSDSAGTATRQAFPVDAYSKALFLREGRAVSVDNVWALELVPGQQFVYELSRPGRLFRVAFDLTRSVSPPYPQSPKGEVVDTWHDTRVADPYRWLEATDSDEARAWVAAQNQYSGALLRQDPRRDAIRARIEVLGAAWPTDEMPRQAGEYLYVAGTDPATTRRTLYVRKGPQGERRPALDLTALPDGHALKAFVPSPDGSHVAYTIDAGGTDWGEIRIRDVAAGKDLPEVLGDVRFSGSVSWSADGRGFLYRRYATPPDARHDAPAKGAAIHRHRLGTPRSADRLVFALPADSSDWSPAFALSEDRRRMYLHLERGPWLEFLGGSRQRVSTASLDAQGLPSEARGFVALTRYDAAYRVVASAGNQLYVMTDLDAPRRRLVAIDRRQPAPDRWRTIIAESAAVMESVHRFGGRFVANYLVDVHSELRTYDARGKPLGVIALPGPGMVRNLTGDAHSTWFRFEYSSLLQPPVVMRHDLRNGTSQVESRGELAPDLGAFETTQRWFASKDGTRVPMYLVARRDLVRDGSHATILHGYGASGTNLLPEFSEDVVAWVEMGGVYAIANVRGGGEFGKAWYEAAIRERKQTSFDDFIAAAEHLVAQGYTSPRKLAIRGSSNGGLLVTASMVQRPSLFALVLADVPVTDALRRGRSGTGALQAEQWGTPQDPAQFRALRAYSPLHNVAPGRCYPATLVTTAANDDRLPPWHAYKFAAALQAAQSCDAPILLRVRQGGGHGGSDDIGIWFDEVADQLAFAARRLELDPQRLR